MADGQLSSRADDFLALGVCFRDAALPVEGAEVTYHEFNVAGRESLNSAHRPNRKYR